MVADLDGDLPARLADVHAFPNGMPFLFQLDHLCRGDCRSFGCIEVQGAHPEQLVTSVAQAFAGNVIHV